MQKCCINRFSRRVVSVKGFKPTTTEDVLELYFDDEDVGGGPIANIDINVQQGEALITFQDPDGKLAK